MRIYLTDEELHKCRQFSIDSAGTQQGIEFGQSDTITRKVSEIARDNLIGKMAEVAISKMLKEQFDLDIPLDFNVYDRGKWDDNDVEINGWHIDIKSTRIGHWLLIEWNKLNFRQKQGELPHAFFMCKTDWDMKLDQPKGSVDLVGCISLNKLKAGMPNVRVLRKGDCIPGTHTRLQADNFGVEFNDLEKDWVKIIEFMLSNSPPDLSKYPNPYTGKTKQQYVNTEQEQIVETTVAEIPLVYEEKEENSEKQEKNLFIRLFEKIKSILK